MPMRGRANQAIYYHQLWSRTAGDRDEQRLKLTSRFSARKIPAPGGICAERIGLLTDRGAVGFGLLTLKSAQPEERASALEILESLREGDHTASAENIRSCRTRPHLQGTPGWST